MTDINLQARSAQPLLSQEANPARDAGELAADDRLLVFVELLFFAYRDFTSEPDAILTEFAFGRAHHRVLHFVHRNPGLRVADLLEILKITKQSLNRVLKQLVDQGYVRQEPGLNDRRQRLLFATDKGATLARRLAELQMARIAKALASTSPEGEAAARQFLFLMITDQERPAVEMLLAARAGSRSAAPVKGSVQP